MHYFFGAVVVATRGCGVVGAVGVVGATYPPSGTNGFGLPTFSGGITTLKSMSDVY